MIFTLDQLQASLRQMPACERALVGFSGGLDSVVLLHSLTQLRERGQLPFALTALHINHGLNPRATHWQQLCADWCSQWGVDFAAVTVAVDTENRQDAASQWKGVENTARNVRYQAFAQRLQTGDGLLLAHHRDDQMETLLLRLLRGSGNKGLMGMPRSRLLGAGFLFRPLLEVDRSALTQYAQAAELTWIDDDSNVDQQFDRNYCRHTLLPLIEARWPGYRESWSKTATLAAESEALLQELAATDLQQVQGATPNELSIDALRQLAASRQRNLLRVWLQNLGLPDPGWNQLQQLTEQFIATSADSNASINGDGFCIARFKNSLLALRELAEIDTDAVLDWHPSKQIAMELPGNGCLRARVNSGTGDARLALPGNAALQLRYRQGGESFQLRDRPRKSLKKILQEQSIPPWCRERYPLLYGNGELLCVPGIGVAESVAKPRDGQGIVIEWQQPVWNLGAD